MFLSVSLPLSLFLSLALSQQCETPAEDAVLEVGVSGTSYLTIDPTVDPANADVSFASSTVTMNGRNVLAEIDALVAHVAEVGTLLTGSAGPVCEGDRDLTDPLHLQNIVSACVKYEGSLTINGDLFTTVNLGEMEEITGALNIGPSTTITSVVAPELVSLGTDAAIVTEAPAAPPQLHVDTNTLSISSLDFPKLDYVGGSGIRVAGGGSSDPMLPLDNLNFPLLTVASIGIGRIDAATAKALTFPSLVNATGYGPCAYGNGFCLERTGSSYTSLSLPALVRVRGVRISKTTGLTSLSFPSVTTITKYNYYIRDNSGISNCEVDPGFDFGSKPAPTPCH
jgi:hypothetical protein